MVVAVVVVVDGGGSSGGGSGRGAFGSSGATYRYHGTQTG